MTDKNLQCRINFIASQIRENRIEYERLSRELKKELENFSKPTLKTRHDMEMQLMFGKV